MTAERVQKVLAQSGYGSRRACEKLIAEGRVSVNGATISLGDKADPAVDEIRLDGQVVAAMAPAKEYIAIYKPRNVLSTPTPNHNGKLVTDLVESTNRLFPIGRLDFESEGLMLLTNDGELANRLTHPRYGHEKEYKVLVARKPDNKQIETWRRGVVLPDGFKTSPTQVYFDRLQGKGAWIKVIMTEGHKRQIRETAQVIGLPVVKLIRVRIASIRLGRLKPGEWRQLEAEEVAELYGNRPARTKSKKRKGPKRTGKR